METVRAWPGAVSTETRILTGSARAERIKGAAKAAAKTIRRPDGIAVIPRGIRSRLRGTAVRTLDSRGTRSTGNGQGGRINVMDKILQRQPDAGALGRIVPGSGSRQPAGDSGLPPSPPVGVVNCPADSPVRRAP